MLFDNKQESNLRSCIQMIEDAIRALGHEPEASRLEVPGMLPAWRVQKGSAHVYIILSARGEENWIRVTAPVLHLDAGSDSAPLFRRLLELNGTQVLGAAFALDKDAVILTVQRSTQDLDQSEVFAMLRHVEEWAERLDKDLVAEFGGRAAGLSTAPIK
jgi:hypothetical protein